MAQSDGPMSEGGFLGLLRRRRLSRRATLLDRVSTADRAYITHGIPMPVLRALFGAEAAEDGSGSIGK